MSNETQVTIRGYAGADPTVFTNDNGRPTVIVNVGVHSRNFRADTNEYVNGPTTWYAVRTYGRLASHVARSVRKGTPVLVRGRLHTRTWTDRSDTERTESVITADGFGIDLNSGTASFVRDASSSPAYTSQGMAVAGEASTVVHGGGRQEYEGTPLAEDSDRATLAETPVAPAAPF